MKIIGCSGVVNVGSGIGVLQRALYPRLAQRGFTLQESANRDVAGGGFARILGFIRGLTPARGTHDVYFSVVPPLPVAVSHPIVSVVHDLRWKDTRSPLGRMYRKWDLRRTIRKSERLICISERTKGDLLAMFPHAADKITVAWLGPGIVSMDAAPLPKEELILLVGGAKHKRNELAAEVIVELAESQSCRVAGVGVSREVEERLTHALGADSCEWYSRITDEDLVALYARSACFMLLGKDEGFGLPYIEALASGCHVIAIDQPLTREILSTAATLVKDGTAQSIAQQVSSSVRPSPSDRQAVTMRYSWDRFADVVAHELAAVVKRGVGR